MYRHQNLFVSVTYTSDSSVFITGELRKVYNRLSQYATLLVIKVRTNNSCSCWTTCLILSNDQRMIMIKMIKGQVTPMKQRKRKRELVSPYKRKKGKEFMEDQKASISSGTWRNLETFCLIVCWEVLLSHSISENPGNLKLLYNFVAQLDSVKAMLLPISVKSTSQIAAKIAYLSKFHDIWKSLTMD